MPTPAPVAREPPAEVRPPPSEPAAVVKFLRATSESVTWTCDRSPCPWGTTTSGQALVWPDWAQPIKTRLGYTASAPVYLPAQSANGMEVSVRTGTATVYAGMPEEPTHRVLTQLSGGKPFLIMGLAPGALASVQSESGFTFDIFFRGIPEVRRPPEGGVAAVPAVWRCDRPDCNGPDWTGQVIPWPAWAAHQSNARAGNQSRSVFSATGEPLYPYMGRWAHGCKVTATFGKVLIVEWKRGSEVWRQTAIEPVQSYVISLAPNEDGALIESNDTFPGFSVSLEYCTPKPLTDKKR